MRVVEVLDGRQRVHIHRPPSARRPLADPAAAARLLAESDLDHAIDAPPVYRRRAV
jgi:hypothetical protein